jgi:crotonobetainyl-CoA:carnitine CoA-transferase CaiB-like acyl-CoA transferase
MAERNVRLVYASVSAFGQKGPWRDRPGVDGVAQAMGGLMSITGTADGPPVKVGIPAADMAAGAYATQAILAALFARERTGLGQRLEVSLLDSALAFQAMPISMYLTDEQVPKRLGSAAAYSAPNQAYATADGYVMVAAYAPKRWTALCEVLEMPELENDPRFDTNEHRVHNRWELAAVLESVFRTKTTAAWVELLDAADIICGPLLSYPELLAADHVREGGSLETVVHPVVGKITSPAFPGRLHGSDRGASLPPPLEPGEHSREILVEFGISDGEIDRFVRDGVVAEPAAGISPARVPVGGGV